MARAPLEVPHAQVVGRRRHPPAVRFGHFGGQVVLEYRQVAGAAEDAFASIEPVGDAEAVGGVGGQHHHAAHPVNKGGGRIPLRFLIGHGGEIAPVDAAARFSVLEVAAVAGQALVEPLEEGLDVGVLQPANVAE